MSWTKISKPNSQTYTNVNPQGKEQYDQPSLTYDDANTFYDGVNQSQWSKTNKPTFPFSTLLDQSQVLENDWVGFGIATITRVAQTFTPSITNQLSKIQIDLGKTGTPTDNIELNIYQDDSGSPGIFLGTADSVISCNSITGGFFIPTLCTFTFYNNLPILTSNVIYWMILSRTGALDENNFPQVFTSDDNPDPYTRGDMYYITSTTWNNFSTDFGGGFFYNFVFNEYYQTVGVDNWNKIAKPI